MLVLKSFITEKVKFDDVEFKIRALTREEFLVYAKRLSEFNAEEGKVDTDDFQELALEVIETCLMVDDPTLKETIMNKIREAPIAVQNELFDRIMKLSVKGK